jgi:polyisoprenyl-teichoic acid--peptidoglycan teichoic acid transferase
MARPKLRQQLWWTVSPLVAAASFGMLAYRNRRPGLAAAQFVSSAAAAGLVGYTATNQRWVDLVVSPTLLTGAVIGAAAVSFSAAAAAATQWRDAAPPRHTRIGQTVAAVGLLGAFAAALSPVAATAWFAGPQIRVARDTFITAPVANPSPLAPIVITPSPRTGTEPDSSNPDTSEAPAPPPGSTRINVLLLGGDAGPGRSGLRTDSMNLVSIDPDTGDAAIIGIPRNLRNAPMPDGALRDRFPDGFPNLLNAVYGWGQANPDQVRDTLGPTELPGASLLAAATAELLGVPVHAWVLIDMAGFIELIDAFGGIDVYVSKLTPSGGNVPSGKHPVVDAFEPGWHTMDGTDALSYVRSRSADSDYGRMSRQRCVLASLAAQNDRASIATSWPGVSAIIAERVRTNLDAQTLRAILALAGSDISATRNLALAPPKVQPSDWDPVLVRSLVATTIDPSNADHLAPDAEQAALRTMLDQPDVRATTSTMPAARTAAPTVADTCRTTR